MLLTSCHHKAKLFLIRIFSGHTSRYLSVKNNLNPIRQAHNLIQFKGYQKYRFVLISLLNKIFMYKLNSTHIQTTGRIYRNQKILIVGYLPGYDNFLLIST